MEKCNCNEPLQRHLEDSSQEYHEGCQHQCFRLGVRSGPGGWICALSAQRFGFPEWPVWSHPKVSSHYAWTLPSSIKPDQCMHREAGSVILKITYGYTAEAHGRDPFVELAGKTMQTFAEATVPGKWIVDILPFCKCSQAGPHNTSNRNKWDISQMGVPVPDSRTPVVAWPILWGNVSTSRTNSSSNKCARRDIRRLSCLRLLRISALMQRWSSYTSGRRSPYLRAALTQWVTYTQLCKGIANRLVDCFLTDDLLLSHECVPRSAEESPRGTRPRHWKRPTAC